jgi:ribose transport system ATP-binding protein
LIADFAVRGGGADIPTERLSGGNQQKIAMARWFPRSPTLFLLNDPTRGVDIETKREIYLRLRQMAESGTAIILLSSDTLELVHLCDRAAVFHRGLIAALLRHDQLSEEAIVAASAGLSIKAQDLSRSWHDE